MIIYAYKIHEVPVKSWLSGRRIVTQEPAGNLNEHGKQGRKLSAIDETNMYRDASRNRFVILQKTTREPL